MVQFGQGFASMNVPMKELEWLVLSKKINHGNNPVLTWMADNLVARVDPAGNIKSDKEISQREDRRDCGAAASRSVVIFSVYPTANTSCLQTKVD